MAGYLSKLLRSGARPVKPKSGPWRRTASLMPILERSIRRGDAPKPSASPEQLEAAARQLPHEPPPEAGGHDLPERGPDDFRAARLAEMRKPGEVEPPRRAPPEGVAESDITLPPSRGANREIPTSVTGPKTEPPP